VPRKSSAAVAFSATTSARLQPPEDLTGPEKSLFVDLVLACRADHFLPSDTPLLCAYCRAVCLEQVASSELAAAGFVIDGKPSGWLPVLAQATRAMTTLSRMLRLSPTGRQSTPASESGAVSYYEKMSLLEGRREHDPNSN
jgi:phage terminase small subunit